MNRYMLYRRASKRAVVFVIMLAVFCLLSVTAFASSPRLNDGAGLFEQLAAKQSSVRT